MSTRKLAAILFADIVGYTALMQQDEQQAKGRLDKFRQVLKEQVPAHQGQIAHFYGDGCLATFETPFSAKNCAFKVQRTLMEEPTVPVRIGLHSGTINIDEDHIYGDAVNLTSRIESMGIPGSILISKKVRDELKNQPDLAIISLGKFAFKNVEEPMEIFTFEHEGFAIPKREEMQGKLKQPATPKPNKWLAPGLALLAIVLIAILAIFLPPWEAHQSGDQQRPSIAILPFENMSTEAENQFFADGMHDDLLTHLSKIGDIKVISRTSVNQYRDTEKTSPEIGRELGVGHLMEGSVRRMGNQLRINIQLIKAETDDHLWSEIYDREVTTDNIFTIQTEIAEAIARVLKTTISPANKQALAEKPTQDLKAYEFYLRARLLTEARNAESLFEAKGLLEKAIQRDSSFALAYVNLGLVYQLLINHASAAHYRPLALEYLNKGMALNDQLAEAYALKGLLATTSEETMEEAAGYFEKAIELNPNYEATYLWYGIALRNKSKNFRKGDSMFQKAYEINPLSLPVINHIGFVYAENGHPRKAIELYKKGINIEPAYPLFYHTICNRYRVGLGELDSAAMMSWKGIQTNGIKGLYLKYHVHSLISLQLFEETANLLDQHPPVTQQDTIIHLQSRWHLALWQKNYEKVMLFDQKLIPYKLNHQFADFITNYAQRDFAQAIQAFENKFPQGFDELVLTRNDYQKLVYLQDYLHCLHQTGQVQKQTLLEQKFGELLYDPPVGKGEHIIEQILRERRRILRNILSGDIAEALNQLDRYYANGFVYVMDGTASFTSDPVFDAVRSHSRFVQIIDRCSARMAKQRETYLAFVAAQEAKND